jgi:catechol 2,3-dioxygenase
MKIHELGHVVLYVSHLGRSADFYKNILGFDEIHRDRHTALFSSGRTHHELLLIEVGIEPQEKLLHPNPGLYHIGFKIGNSDDDLRDAVRELENYEVSIVGMSDHHVTHSVYILDPDGNELELYVDIDDVWKKDPSAILRPVKRLTL